MKKFILVLSLCVVSWAFFVPSAARAAQAMSDEEFLKLCASGSLEEVENAIKAGANVNAADSDKWTALHFAALENGDHEVLGMLLDNGAVIDAKDDSGDTPLLNAAIRGRPKHMLLLLNRGADAGVTNHEGNSAMDYLKEWEEIIERLKAAEPAAMNDARFLSLCRSGTPQQVEQAIAAGANVNAVNPNNWTALHIAALQNDNPDVMRVLLDNGANVNVKDNDGDTPLMNAVISNKPKHIILLLDRGADAEIADNQGNKPLHYLSESTPDEVDEAEWAQAAERLKKASE